MHTYRFFFLAMSLGIGCVHTIRPMLLVNDSDKKNDVVIGMHHFWSDDYCQNISAIKDKDLKSIRSQLKSDLYLSPHVRAIDHLLYLSTIRKNNGMKTLFTNKQR